MTIINLIRLIIIGVVIYALYVFWRAGLVQRKMGQTLPKYLIYAVIGSVVFVPICFHLVGDIIDDIAHPIPTVSLNSKTVKIANDADTGTINGATKPGIKVHLNSLTDTPSKTVTSNDNGKFKFSGLSAGDYSISAKDGDAESSEMSVTVKSGSSSTDDKPNTKAQISAFSRDMHAYLDNKYPEIAFSYDRTEDMATFSVPNEVADMSKTEQKSYVKPIYDRINTFANANDLNNTPSLYMKTQDGTMIARNGMFGFKVYAKR